LSSFDARPKVDASLVLDSVEYLTNSGARRWAGCFCSTWNTQEAD
jgi:hypothetical protein